MLFSFPTVGSETCGRRGGAFSFCCWGRLLNLGRGEGEEVVIRHKWLVWFILGVSIFWVGSYPNADLLLRWQSTHIPFPLGPPHHSKQPSFNLSPVISMLTPQPKGKLSPIASLFGGNAACSLSNSNSLSSHHNDVPAYLSSFNISTWEGDTCHWIQGYRIDSSTITPGFTPSPWGSVFPTLKAPQLSSSTSVE